MSNPHHDEAKRQLAHLEKLRNRNRSERAGWGPTPLQAQQHQTGAATGLTFSIETGKYQLGWREKLYFKESGSRQQRRKETLKALEKIDKQIIGHWEEFHKLHQDTADYIKEKERLENKLSSQKRLDDFRKQFNASLATYQRVGLTPEMYLTRWYTNYMKDLWFKEDLRTFYSGERKMIGPGAVPGRRSCPGIRAADKEMEDIVKHSLPGNANDRWAHQTPVGSYQGGSGPAPLGEKYPAGTEFKNRTDSCGVPITLRGLKDSRQHFLDLNKTVPQQKAISQERYNHVQQYTVQGTLPYLTDTNSAAGNPFDG